MSVKVTGVNDAPALELDLDSYTFEEDMDDYVSLGPMFVSDSDAGASAWRFHDVTHRSLNCLPCIF